MSNKLFMILFLSYNAANGQARTGFEEYYYSSGSGISALVSKAYYQDSRHWYGEVRYNYEEEQTFSLYAGKTFSREDSLSYSFTPLAGIVVGKFRGGSIGMNMTLERKNFIFSSVLQYTASVENKKGNFLFSWSELGYQATSYFYAGLTLQQTCLYQTACKWEPGIQVSISYRKWVFPVYAFSPMDDKRYFVLGITREWEHHK
jgi:hypothetical protein